MTGQAGVRRYGRAMNELSMIGVMAREGREEEARKIMEALGYKPEDGTTSWFVPAGGSFPTARAHLIERLDKHDWDWGESLTVGDLPDHPDA